MYLTNMIISHFQNFSYSKTSYPLRLKSQNKFTTPDSLKSWQIPVLHRKFTGQFGKLFNKKIPCIPLIFHRNKFVDFKQKADMFIHFLASQCTLVNSTSKLPSIFESWILQSLLTVDFISNDIEKIMKNLATSKAHGYDMICMIWCHGYDMISIHGVKICVSFIYKPVIIVPQKTANFSLTWERQMLFLFIKRW